MHRSMDACVDGFIAGRDERKLSKVRLLIEQMRLNLKHIKELNTACRMELTVLCWGQAGALVPLEILDNVTKNMAARVDCIEGMRQGLLALKNDAEQEAFVAHLTPRLRDVKAQTAEIFMLVQHFMTLPRIAGFRTASSRPPPPPSHAAVTATSVAAVGKGGISVAVCKDVRHAEGGSYGERLSPVLLAVARSIDKLVQDYQRARLHILYGRDDPNEIAVWESFEGSVSYQGGLQDDEMADSLHEGGTPLPSPPAPHLFAPGTAQKDARIIFEETPIGFDRGIHDKVAADWARHGYRGPFARGCFMSNLVTFSVMLARLVDMEVALERNRGLSAFAKLRVAVYAMAADTWEALSPFIAFGRVRKWLSARKKLYGADNNPAWLLQAIWQELKSQDAASLHCVKVAGILTAASLFTLMPELSVKFYPGAWVAFSCGVILAEDTGSAVAMGSQRLLGSVMGAIYAWMLTSFTIGDSVDMLSSSIKRTAIIGLPPWIALCCFFRHSPTHGYAAVVAAFTAVLIMVGIFTPAVHQAYSPVVRIQNTIIGVVLYFALDNIIWPARAITALQRHLAGGLGVMRKEVEALEASASRALQHEVTPSTATAPSSPPTSLLQAVHSAAEGLAKSPNRADDHHRLLDAHTPSAKSSMDLQQHEAAQSGFLRHINFNFLGSPRSAAPITPPLHLIPLPPVALGGLKQVADSLEHQAKSIHLAAQEPTLWHRPFHHPSYLAVLAAERDVLAALILVKRAEQSFFTSCTDELWSAEVKQRSGIMTRVGALLRIARMSLQDAENIFSAPVQPTRAALFGVQVRNACAPTVTKEGRVQQAQRLLQLQVEAELLHEAIDQDMVTLMTIGPPAGQAPQTSVQFALRFTTTTFSVLRLHKGLLTLGHAITDLLEREARIFYYT
eukprot:TRINITY_DN737_c0_g1_i3.p1 TRINITY_DN737_c0_g1~~TRINITY_DN737_c0_g1_i3.p1  ORF type:complete len:903 (+),score=232.72 TRINITY_DN737_c0_g1_i3:1173-3881(+)